MLIVYRTHSQTLALLREEGKGAKKSWTLLEVAHVHDQAKVDAWRKRGAV